jgi:hypothetical protein
MPTLAFTLGLILEDIILVLTILFSRSFGFGGGRGFGRSFGSFAPKRKRGRERIFILAKGDIGGASKRYIPLTRFTREIGEIIIIATLRVSKPIRLPGRMLKYIVNVREVVVAIICFKDLFFGLNLVLLFGLDLALFIISNYIYI